MLYLKTFGTLFILLGVLLVIAFFLKKWGAYFNLPIAPLKKSRQIQLLEVTSLDGKNRLALVKMNKKEYLLALHPTIGVTLLDTIDTPSSVFPPVSEETSS